MRQVVTRGIVLTRTDFQEADRVLTLLTPDHGKVHVLAKGVRRPKSKLAGGIELLSISDITYLPGRGELGTLVSSRLITHFANIVTDINRTMLAYELIKRLNHLTEDAAGEEYFELMQATLAGLNNLALGDELIELWFSMQLLKLSGHAPNLRTDTTGKPLTVIQRYAFSFDDMMFAPSQQGPHTANLIKLLRLGLGANQPLIFNQIAGTEETVGTALQLARSMVKYTIRV